jgi:SAM-dependent methyltransferase
MFLNFRHPLQAKRNEYSSKVIDNIKFVQPSLLKDKLIPKSTKIHIMYCPFIRLTILGLVIYASKQLRNGMSLLDVGAGDCPYKDIFTHITYKSADFGEAESVDFKEIDYFCPADSIPVSEKSFDAILCTEVLEHVPEPKSVLIEFNRVLKNNGHLFVTTPFIYPLHMEPYDFFRYTPYAFKNLLKEAGFEIVFITSRGGWIASVADTLLRRRYLTRPQRNVKSLLLYCFLFLPIFALPMLILRLLPLRPLAWLDKNLDNEQTYTIGYALHAIKIKDLATDQEVSNLL